MHKGLMGLQCKNDWRINFPKQESNKLGELIALTVYRINLTFMHEIGVFVLFETKVSPGIS